MKKALLIAALASSISLVGCSDNGLHDAMEDMGGSLKATYQAESVDVMKAELDKFMAALNSAKQQKVIPDQQADFEEGLQEVETLILQMKAALDSGNVEQAKAIFPQLKEVKEKYHEMFEVK